MARWALAAAVLVPLAVLAVAFHGSILWTIAVYTPPKGEPPVIKELKAMGYNITECPTLMEAARWRASILGAIYAKFGVDTAHDGFRYVMDWLGTKVTDYGYYRVIEYVAIGEVIILADDTLKSLDVHAPAHYGAVMTAAKKNAYYGYAYILQPSRSGFCKPYETVCESFTRIRCEDHDFNRAVWYVVIVFAEECPAGHFPYRPVNFSIPTIDVFGFKIVDPRFPGEMEKACKENFGKKFDELLALLEK